MAKPRKIRGRQSNNSKARRQQHYRRGGTLFRKAFEFCQECNADISMLVRLKDSGQIYVFNSNERWIPSQEELILYYPTPRWITWQELAAKYDS
ncbi:uncharacterized protein ATNIH1004_003996 [Aspergillus tanneri]|uniref:MADS-box domain-containing protein n=1 Tax=Aspergillus tanneri TaxID=1220188 RepID=A0A5M9MTA2_9EURO|nr:uncharacterized protein ATNIH1004_003996 [Aspergillus tanneri]KAA8648113.1 hypothetical protein ATNIH1004_003996 [Aspergillus tanneri]